MLLVVWGAAAPGGGFAAPAERCRSTGLGTCRTASSSRTVVARGAPALARVATRPRATPSVPSSVGRPWPSSAVVAAALPDGGHARPAGGAAVPRGPPTGRGRRRGPRPRRPRRPGVRRRRGTAPGAVVRHSGTGDHRRLDAPRGHPARRRRAPAGVAHRRTRSASRCSPGSPCRRTPLRTLARPLPTRHAGRVTSSARRTVLAPPAPTGRSTPPCASGSPTRIRGVITLAAVAGAACPDRRKRAPNRYRQKAPGARPGLVG